MDYGRLREPVDLAYRGVRRLSPIFAIGALIDPLDGHIDATGAEDAAPT